MVIRRFMPLWTWGALALLFGSLCVGISAGFTIYTVTSTVRHECSALNYIIQRTPMQRQNTVFYHDVVIWAKSDGC